MFDVGKAESGLEVGDGWGVLGEVRQGYRFCSCTLRGFALKLDMGSFWRVARLSEESTDNTMYWSLALLLERSDLMKTACPGLISGKETRGAFLLA